MLNSVTGARWRKSKSGLLRTISNNKRPNESKRWLRLKKNLKNGKKKLIREPLTKQNKTRCTKTLVCLSCFFQILNQRLIKVANNSTKSKKFPTKQKKVFLEVAAMASIA